MSEMVDRVTRTLEAFAAMQESNPGGNENYWGDMARQVIGAMRVPTEAMCRAGCRTILDQHPDITWPLMIDAALTGGDSDG